jgi:hypothetical protein
MKTTLTILALALALSGAAYAQQGDEPDPEPEVRYNKRTSIVFGPLEMTGRQKRPDGTLINTRPDVRFRSLVKVRTDFRRELLRSAGEL